jgi:hypothetical protein
MKIPIYHNLIEMEVKRVEKYNFGSLPFQMNPKQTDPVKNL